MSVREDIPCAIRVFHYYQRYWKPFLGENLICLHDKGNLFDVFAIKVVQVVKLLDTYRGKSPMQ